MDTPYRGDVLGQKKAFPDMWKGDSPPEGLRHRVQLHGKAFAQYIGNTRYRQRVTFPQVAARTAYLLCFPIIESERIRF